MGNKAFLSQNCISDLAMIFLQSIFLAVSFKKPSRCEEFVYWTVQGKLSRLRTDLLCYRIFRLEGAVGGGGGVPALKHFQVLMNFDQNLSYCKRFLDYFEIPLNWTWILKLIQISYHQFYMPVCEFACVQVHLYMCTCLCRWEDKLTFWDNVPYQLRLARRSGWLVSVLQPSFYICLPSTAGTVTFLHACLLTWIFRPNPGPHAAKASTLLTELSL